MKKKTVGQAALELQQKSTESVTVIDQQRSMQENYMNNLWEAVDRGLKKYTGNFFIDVKYKRERLLVNVFRTYFIDRQSCPTPNYDQDVYEYKRESNELILHWSIPDRESTHHIKDNALLIPDEEKALLQFVLDYADGTLDLLCKRLNNEKYDSPLLDKEN